MVEVKICGLRTREDAEFARDCGADYLGFVFEPSSPRCFGDPSQIPDWISELAAKKVAVFGVCNLAHLPKGFDIVQSVEWLSSPQSRWQAVRLKPQNTVQEVLESASGAQKLLIDAYHQGAFGGTGHRADWDLAARIVTQSSIPVGLAGGLSPENVAEAINAVRPHFVDVSSGVESSPGIKDREKLRAFIKAAKGA
ncbi:MAG: phosphoribosylanthranilate isomerase [Fimbriimonadaceae bacterium]|nr:phosphoribosylanthranilate isomerase [Fimbriimonadaceae bacterium]